MAFFSKLASNRLPMPLWNWKIPPFVTPLPVWRILPKRCRHDPWERKKSMVAPRFSLQGIPNTWSERSACDIESKFKKNQRTWQNHREDPYMTVNISMMASFLIQVHRLVDDRFYIQRNNTHTTKVCRGWSREVHLWRFKRANRDQDGRLSF